MVSEDSTSRVMVLPVTVNVVSRCCGEMSRVAMMTASPECGELTGLDEDLHVDDF
jgi:hypothetical protein